MEYIRLDDLRNWRAERIQHGNCSFDDMVALGCFIDKVEKFEERADEKTISVCNP